MKGKNKLSDVIIIKLLINNEIKVPFFSNLEIKAPKKQREEERTVD